MSKLHPSDQLPTEPAFLAHLLKNWGISSFSFEEAKFGIENRTIFITEPARKGVLRIYRQNRKSVNDIRDELEYMDALSQDNHLIPRIYRTNQGKLFAETYVNGTVWRSLFMEQKEGSHPLAYTEQNVVQMGKALADLHLQSLPSTCHQTHIAPTSVTVDDYVAVQQLMSDRPDVLAFIQPFERLEIQAADLPSAHIHNDFIRTNLLWKEEALTGILDFDDTEYHWLILDVATSAWHIALQDTNFKLAKQFIESYKTIRPLSEREQSVLLPLMHLVNGFRGADQILLQEFNEEWEQILKLETAFRSIW